MRDRVVYSGYLISDGYELFRDKSPRDRREMGLFGNMRVYDRINEFSLVSGIEDRWGWWRDGGVGETGNI